MALAVFNQEGVFATKTSAPFRALVKWMALALLTFVASASMAQTGPKIGLRDTTYRDVPELWTADEANGAQCKSFAAPNGSIVFIASGYAEIVGGWMHCFGTSTETWVGPGSPRVTVGAVWLTYLSCTSDQEIKVKNEILAPRITIYGRAYASASCQCYRYQQYWNGSACSYSTSAITLAGPTETRPKGTTGNSTIQLIAKVTNGGNPKSGVSVSFSADVAPNSGGHQHHDGNRAKGILSAVQGTTDANGEVRLTFSAPEAAGIHTVSAACASCSITSATKEVKVKVPDLILIPADTQSPPRYVFVGQTAKHSQSHFVSDGSWQSLKLVIDTFLTLGWGQVGINDASLEWGGMFDIEGKWLQKYMNSNGKWVSGGHAEHRNGEQVDISFTRPAGVSMALRKKAFREVCNTNRTSLSPEILWHENDGYAPHFHIYLAGKAGAPAAGQNNQCTKK